MRVLVATVVSVSLLTVGATASTTDTQVVRSKGISVALPRTWHLTDEVLSVCTSPGQVMAITNSSVPIGEKVRKGIALILVLEDRYSKPSFFPPPRGFRLRLHPGLLIGCCGMPIGYGEEFSFLDHGRKLYAFAYVGSRSLLATTGAVLNSLSVDAP